ncbi:hypothetical protein NX862_13405 [Rhodobacter sp. KR11]|uniref:hypothetical protein n=1 Tax=Rhodobacter sp. KR11 TaxID=2974588 RepID=UPI002221CE17|nr:hypothetical protein [Rhodobacter sp. KR11]MCW1919753.1 hypothetical protein [Rhodobacter sp. KR11]
MRKCPSSPGPALRGSRAPKVRSPKVRPHRLAHVLGSHSFHSVRDPWGSCAEYAADIDCIPATCDWEAGDFPPEDSIYLWGPEMPGDFIVNHEADG